MKRIFNSIFVLSTMLGLTVACSKPAIDENGGGTTIAETPFSAVSVTAEDVTVDGVIAGTSVTFTFEKNVDVTAAELDITMNEGWTLTYPTDPKAYDMTASDIDLYFEAVDGSKMTYDVTVNFDTNPIADASKIKVGSFATTVNAATNEIIAEWDSSMDFNYDTKTDPRSSITVTFESGALKDGAEYKGEASYDLTAGAVQFPVSYKGSDVVFTLKIDYTARMESYRDWGFTDISADLVPEEYNSAITVYSAKSLLKAIPPKHIGSESQSWWDCTNVSDQYHKMALLADYDVDIMSDATVAVSSEPTEISIVLVDPNVLQGAIVTNADMSITPDAVEAVVAITGANDQTSEMLISDGSTMSTEILYPAPGPWRSAFIFGNDGKLSFSQVAAKDGNICNIPFFEFEGARNAQLTDDNIKPRNNYAQYIQDPVSVESLASGKPWFVKYGRKLSFKDVICNDGATETTGDGIYGTRCGSFIGTTYDGKIAMAAVHSGEISAVRIAYALYRLGWDNILYMGGASWLADSFRPAIYVNGKSVTSTASPNMSSMYVVAFNPVSK